MDLEKAVGKIDFELKKYNSHLIELAEALFSDGGNWDIFRRAILRRTNDLRRDIGEHLGEKGKELMGNGVLEGAGDGSWERKQPR